MMKTMLNMPLTFQDIPADNDQGLPVLTVWLSRNPVDDDDGTNEASSEAAMI